MAKKKTSRIYSLNLDIQKNIGVFSADMYDPDVAETFLSCRALLAALAAAAAAAALERRWWS